MTAARTPRPGYAYDLHFRQHYALSTSDDPGNAKWKQRSSWGFPGKIIVYSRQRYALNHMRAGSSGRLIFLGELYGVKKCEIEDGEKTLLLETEAA